ncbi:hypothetical protein IH575_04985 [Candidatus Dojkabacteria bacterium]|nr:hypothetical protein [Candidatus Dojkabacteria bacterium]
MKYLIIIIIVLFSAQGCNKPPAKEVKPGGKTIQITRHNPNYFEVWCNDSIYFEYTDRNSPAEALPLLNDIYECED